MAEQKKSEAYDPMQELVPFYAFKDGGKYKDDIFVSVNFKTYQIRRGEQVMIPRPVYNVLMTSMEQDNKTADRIADQGRAFKAMNL